MKTVALLFIALAGIIVQGQSPILDDASQTLAACGKPHRDYTFPKERYSERQTRFLTYKGATLWFMAGDHGWSFEGWGRTQEETPVLSREGIEDVLPCFRKVVAPPVVAASQAAPIPSATPSSDAGEFVIFLILAPLGAALYFLPWIVAARRRVHTQGGIIALDVLLGWTFLGWAGALIWALNAETRRAAQLRETAFAKLAQDYTPPSSQP